MTGHATHVRRATTCEAAAIAFAVWRLQPVELLSVVRTAHAILGRELLSPAVALVHLELHRDLFARSAGGWRWMPVSTPANPVALAPQRKRTRSELLIALRGLHQPFTFAQARQVGLEKFLSPYAARGLVQRDGRGLYTVTKDA